VRLALLVVLGLVAVGLWRGSPEPRVVTVLVERASGVPERASGFVVDGRVVTVAHPLGGGAVSVDGRAAHVARVSRDDDLAVLQLRIEGKRVGGAGVRVLRAGGAVEAAVRRRITAHIDGRARPALELAADVAAGDSGAPVVDGRGHLLGVVFARSRTRPGTAYAVDADAVHALLER
jgi:hypothetical protein